MTPSAPIVRTKPGSLDTASVLWSIAEVERDTGLGKDTLRVWERRYGFPRPSRDPLGERQYSHAQLLQLRLIKRLLGMGFRPGKVVGLNVLALEQLCEQATSLPRPAHSQLPHTASELEAQWLLWLQTNQFDTLRHALQQHIMRFGLGLTVDQLIAPLCVAVGEAWLRGDLSIYQEHLFTQTVQNLMREAMGQVDSLARGQRKPPKVLLATTPSEHHQLGLLMAECFFTVEGCDRLALGPRTPVPDIAQAAIQLGVDIVALSFSAHASKRDVSDSLAQLCDLLPTPIELWVGGSALALQRKGLPQEVLSIKRASDISLQVAGWRLRHPTQPA
jgi:MerR family transcriptional regulator, light-induced transcriptional regulator